MDNIGDVYNWNNATYSTKVKPEHILWIDFTGLPAVGLDTNGEASYQRVQDLFLRLKDNPRNKKVKKNE